MLLFVTTLIHTAVALTSPRALLDYAKQFQLNMYSAPDFPSSSTRDSQVAFIGNSIQYFNDTPRFLVRLSRQAGSITTIHQDSCFRGGVNLVELWEQGNGMLKHGFASEAAVSGTDDNGNKIYDVGAATVEELIARKEWDFIVINDHTQGPARVETRDATIDILTRRYAPLIAKSRAVSIIIETPAYRLEGINNSHDLGTTKEFQHKVREGVQKYLEVLKLELPQSIPPRIAPVGTAYSHIRENNFELWEQLFDSYDSFHPSPKGTFLQGCVLFYTMFSNLPPIPTTSEAVEDLWSDARMMNNARRKKGYEEMPFPTLEEVNYFCHVAQLVCEKEMNGMSQSNNS